jgi:hypothetical protein
MVELGFGALDETLKLNLAQGWFKLTGDQGHAQKQAEFFGASSKQRQAIALFAGLCAAKYQAAIQFLPEIGLAVAIGGYAINWRIAFNKLHQAAALKAKEEKKDPPRSVATDAAQPPAK